MKISPQFLKEQLNSGQLSTFIDKLTDKQKFSPVLHFFFKSEYSFDPKRKPYKSILEKTTSKNLNTFIKDKDFLENGISEIHWLLDLKPKKECLLHLPFFPINNEILERLTYESLSLPELYYIYTQPNFIKLDNTFFQIKEMITNRLIFDNFDELDISQLPPHFFDEFETPFLTNLLHCNKLGHFLFLEDQVNKKTFYSVYHSMTEVSNSHFSFDFLKRNIQVIFQCIYTIQHPTLFKNLPSVQQSTLINNIDVEPESVIDKLLLSNNFTSDEIKELKKSYTI